MSLLWQLRCHCNPDHNKFSSLSNTTAVAIFPKLCLWRRSLCSNLGGIGPEKLYRATLRVETFQNIVTKTLRGFEPFSHALSSLPFLPVPQWGLHVLSFEDQACYVNNILLSTSVGSCQNCSTIHGKCVKGFCVCELGWEGQSCELKG